jgi:hypothetical protein
MAEQVAKGGGAAKDLGKKPSFDFNDAYKVFGLKSVWPVL